MESTPQSVQDRAREFQEQLGPQLENAAHNLKELDARARSFIRENPGTCLLGAVALGFLIGKLASRR